MKEGTIVLMDLAGFIFPVGFSFDVKSFFHARISSQNQKVKVG